MSGKGRQLIKGEEKTWEDIHGYQVATSNARIMGDLCELKIDSKSGKITDIVVKTPVGSKVTYKGAKREGDLLIIPFNNVEKVGEFIIITGK